MQADRPYIPPKDGWKSSTHSVKSTNEDDGKVSLFIILI